MRYVPRLIESELLRAAKRFPALILTGPRRAGKTTLLRKAFPKAAYYLDGEPRHRSPAAGRSARLSGRGKRLVKSPKLYFLDSGLVCHLLGIETQRLLNQSPFLGPIFEGFIASEIVKQQIAAGRPKALYYFRDQQGLEVDFLLPRANEKLWLIEAKASRTATPAMAEPLVRLSRAMARRAAAQLVVYRGESGEAGTTALHPEAKALPVDDFLSALAGK